MSTHSRRRKRNKNRQNACNSFEKLEPRQLLAGISFDDASGLITIEGSSNDDFVQVTQEGSQVKVSFQNVEEKSVPASQVTGVQFYGYAGNDWFKNSTTFSATAFGHSGNDSLLGGAAADRLLGGSGDDYLVGGAGNDFLNGHDGNDRLLGNGDDDTLIGSAGDDRIVGGSGNDYLSGDDGKDSMFGLDGDDFLDGGNDDDLMVGNNGRDSMRGRAGNDRLLGGDDDDRLHGDEGDDDIYAGNGDDRAFGEDGNDHISGHNGRDMLFGDLGDDSLFGGNDDDQIMGANGMDRIIGGLGNDWLYGENDDDYLNGQDGDDRIYAGDGDDLVRGERGFDKLYGQNGKDNLDGGDDNDDLWGGEDADWMRGGHGNDDYMDDDSDRLVDDDDDYLSGDDFEVRGTIEQLDMANRTFTVLGLSVDFSSAKVEGSLSEGALIKVEGGFDGTTLTAREVERENDSRNKNFEATGVVENLDSQAQTFQLYGITVSYSNAEGRGSVQAGATVKVEGRLQAGAVTAYEIENYSGGSGDDSDDDNSGDDNSGDDNSGDRDSNGDLELRGNIANLDPSARTFTVLGIPVSYTGAEVKGSLSDGAYIKVEGNFDGQSLQAREVERELPDDRDENFEARGVISDLNTSDRTFKLLGFVVDYSNTSNSNLQDGLSVDVEGWLASDLVTAHSIRV